MKLLLHILYTLLQSIFFFNDTATTEIYTLSLHDALPIWVQEPRILQPADDEQQVQAILRFDPKGCAPTGDARHAATDADAGDRKSTRLNSSHANISYAVFCLKKKIRTA